MDHDFFPGDKVSFFANGKTLRGKVLEVTLWRRDDSIAYKILCNKETFWRSADRVKP